MTTTLNKTADISSNNPIPNIPAYVAAGHRHLIRKVTEGTGYHWFEGDGVADAAHARGVHVGHYHWLREDQDAIAQANAFVAAVKPHLGKPATTLWDEASQGPNGDWLMDDCEQTASVAFPGDRARARQVKAFHKRVRQLLPEYILTLYSGNWYADNRPALQRQFRRWPFIIAAYQSTMPPNPYRFDFFAWQTTDRAIVAGFSAPVDYNTFLGTASRTAQPKEPKVGIVNGVRVLRAIVLGGKYATPALQKKYPRLVRKIGVRAEVDGLAERMAVLERKEAKKA